MNVIHYYKLDNGAMVKNRPIEGIHYTDWVSLTAKTGYVLENIWTGKKLTGLVTPFGTEIFWKEVLLDEVE